jgi:hypothetical protein
MHDDFFKRVSPKIKGGFAMEKEIIIGSIEKRGDLKVSGYSEISFPYKDGASWKSRGFSLIRIPVFEVESMENYFDSHASTVQAVLVNRRVSDSSSAQFESPCIIFGDTEKVLCKILEILNQERAAAISRYKKIPKARVLLLI